jgi:hypothetical protein
MKVKKSYAPFHVVDNCGKFVAIFGKFYFFWVKFFSKKREFAIYIYAFPFFSQNDENLSKKSR